MQKIKREEPQNNTEVSCQITGEKKKGIENYKNNQKTVNKMEITT